MDEIERLQAENRRLRAQAERAREDLELLGERLGYALHQVAELRRRVPDTVTQAAAPGSEIPPRGEDPLVRFFDALRRR
jgi:hypothetical protein